MFKIIIPCGERITVENDTLVQENPDYLAGTTYNYGDKVEFGNLVYQCNIDGTVGKYPFDYSVINSSAYNRYNGSTTYAIGDIVWYTAIQPVRIKNVYGRSPGTTPRIKVPFYSNLKGVPKVVNSDVKLYKCILASTGNVPTNTTYWSEIPTHWTLYGTDNYFACVYDKDVPNSLNNSQLTYSHAEDYIEVAFKSTETEFINPTSLFVLNFQADWVYVYLKDPVTQDILWSSELSGVNYGNITDWYNYFFAPYQYVNNMYFSFPNISSSEIHVKLYNSLASGLMDVKVGMVYIGYEMNMGDTLFAPTFTLNDYSTKGYDDYGNISIEEGNYQKQQEFQVKVPRSYYDIFIDTIIKYRAIPLVWVLDDKDANSVIYGYASDFSVQYQTTEFAFVSLTLQSI